MAKDGNIVDLKHNWPKEQLVQKANYNWKSINKRIQKLETDIKSGVYMKNYSNKQNGDSNNSTISNVQSTTNYNDDSGYDSQGAKNPSIEAVKNAVAEVETMADEAISATDDIINNKLPELKEGVTQEITNTMAATYVKNDEAYSAVVQNASLVASKVSNSEFNSYKTQVPGLIAEQVSVYRRTNIVKSEKFSEIIQSAMNRYLNGMLTNEEVIQELLKLAKDIAAAAAEGEKLGLTADELAFYDALTKPQAIKDFYEHDELIAITKELTDLLRKNRTIDWQKKESARAGMRRLVKRLLKKHKYPPEGMDDAVQTVMSQCEMWTDNVMTA